MKPSVMILVFATVLCVPARARASSGDEGSAPVQTGATATAAPPEQRTGFRTLFRDVIGDFAHVPTRDSLFVASLGVGAALAVHPADSTFNEHLENTSFFNAGDRLGNDFTMMGATFAVYGVGLATGHDRVTHVALDVVRSQVVTEVLVQAVKVAVRRERPDGSSGYSFPSGHAAITFSTATVLQRRYGLKWALPAYGLASYVAASRLHDNLHYLSDVAFGAAVGTLAGRTVTRHGVSNYAFLPLVVPGGFAFVIVRSHRES